MNNLLSDDAVACIKELHKLLKLAEQGRMRGLAFAVSFHDEDDCTHHNWDVQAVGSYRSYPLEAIGPVNVLRLTVERWALDGYGPSEGCS